MSAAEFAEWEVYDSKIDPFGDWRADVRSGMAASAIVNVLRAGHSIQGGQPAKASDFILDLRGPRQQSPLEMKTIFKAFAEAWNLREKQREKMLQLERDAQARMKQAKAKAVAHG